MGPWTALRVTGSLRTLPSEPIAVLVGGSQGSLGSTKLVDPYQYLPAVLQPAMLLSARPKLPFGQSYTRTPTYEATSNQRGRYRHLGCNFVQFGLAPQLKGVKEALLMIV